MIHSGTNSPASNMCEMLHRVALLLCVVVVELVVCGFGPAYPPTQGEVWPKPLYEDKSDVRHFYHPDYFKYEVMTPKHDCALLKHAIERCKAAVASVEDIARLLGHRSSPHRDYTKILRLEIELYQPCEKYPHADMDEEYNLTVAEVSKLKSSSIWGIIRGLETFSQLFYLSNCYKHVFINETTIVDRPQYPHRGLLIDTGRHYLAVAKILKTLDAMAMNKMNVLHWHIVDDQSFPYQSDKYPELSAKGAFHPSLVYTRGKIRSIIEYARLRGIRVMVEFDGPGHVLSLGRSHPEVMTECDSRPPFNPTKNSTYILLNNLLAELQDLFPEKYLHLGGDEVNMNCWNEDPSTVAYMKEHKVGKAGLLTLYMTKLMPLLKQGTVPVLWQEVFNTTFSLLAPKNTVFHIWNWGWEEKMVEVLHHGFRLIVSSFWYLDYYLKYEFWDFYAVGDPRLMVVRRSGNATLAAGVLGGEAAMWGEMVDDTNIISRVWPRTSAIAEVLWSVTNGTVPRDAHSRLEEHACRMRRRGVPAEPGTGPGFCVDKNNAVPAPEVRTPPKTSKRGYYFM